MKKRSSLLNRTTFQSFFSFVLFCGFGLLASIPPAQRITDAGFFLSLTQGPIYFYAHTLFLGILGLNLGAISAERTDWSRTSIRLGEQILLAQILTSPYLFFMKGLHPAGAGILFLFVLYTTLVGLLCALFGYWIERPWAGKATRGFVLKYLLFFLYYLAPLTFWPIISPLGSVTILLEVEQLTWLIVLFIIPAGLVMGVLTLLHRQTSGGDRV